MAIEQNKLLSEITRFGIGGPADFFVCVSNTEELKQALSYAFDKKLNHIVIGEGTNLLVSDQGFKGLVIQIGFNQLEWDDLNLTVRVGAGVNLMSLIEQANKKGWSGMQSMYGIPGNVGAGVYGNVGAYGTEIKDALVKVLVWNENKILEMTNKDCLFRYRTSTFKNHKELIILEAELKFERSNSDELQKYSAEILQKRTIKYPPGLKCPGSYFKNILIDCLTEEQKKNVEAYQDRVKGGKLPCGVLLEAVGAKGTQEGGIKVADYHGNLIFNKDHGKAADVAKLTAKLKNKVWEKFGIMLEEEVQFVGKIN